MSVGHASCRNETEFCSFNGRCHGRGCTCRYGMILYRERLAKYVPVEIIVLYVAAYGILYAVASENAWFSSAALVFLIAGIVAVPLYLWKAERVGNRLQIAISIVGFVTLCIRTWRDSPVSPAGLQSGHRMVALPVYVFVSPLFEGMPDRW